MTYESGFKDGASSYRHDPTWAIPFARALVAECTLDGEAGKYPVTSEWARGVADGVMFEITQGERE